MFANLALQPGTGLPVIDKCLNTVAEAVAEIKDGATIHISGFGEAGNPIELVHA